MENKVEISAKDLKEVVSFVIALGDGVERSLADDGKLTVGDLPNLFPVLFKIMPAIQGAENIPVYIKAMDKAEADELLEFVKTELELEDEDVESFIEDATRIVLDLWIVLNKYFFKAVPEENTDETSPNGVTPEAN